ncbi:ABC transporter permease subunit [Ensifer canadensis]|uniref:ABC transporter permease subunit n=1 Tax=Ensifer canadensis TaxID=555315 RepID=UPI002352D282|nr:ABC transporter permease subunit [Ensifer canadensis]
MIEILQEYWKAYLWTDGYRITGVAMTLWLLVASIVLGFVLAIPLSVARASANPYIRVPVWLYTYVFRGTPLYVQLLILYTGFYSFSFVRSVPLLDSFFREGPTVRSWHLRFAPVPTRPRSSPAPSAPCLTVR